MADEEIHATIKRLTDEEHELERSHAGEPPTSEHLERLDAIRVSLDQCWDLLRQRRARREFGGDPDLVHPRSPETVEGYEQ